MWTDTTAAFAAVASAILAGAAWFQTYRIERARKADDEDALKAAAGALWQQSDRKDSLMTMSSRDQPGPCSAAPTSSRVRFR